MHGSTGLVTTEQQLDEAYEAYLTAAKAGERPSREEVDQLMEIVSQNSGSERVDTIMREVEQRLGLPTGSAKAN